jgi:hypothetical protein
MVTFAIETHSITQAEVVVKNPAKMLYVSAIDSLQIWTVKDKVAFNRNPAHLGPIEPSNF